MVFKQVELACYVEVTTENYQMMSLVKCIHYCRSAEDLHNLAVFCGIS